MAEPRQPSDDGPLSPSMRSSGAVRSSPSVRSSGGVRHAAVSVAGVVIAAWGAVVLAATGAFFTPYRIGSVLVPVSLLLVAAGNAALITFGYAVTRRRMLALLPGLVWLVVSFLGANPTAEGDVVLTQSNWVAAVYVIVGCLAIAATAYRLFATPHPRPADAQAPQ